MDQTFWQAHGNQVTAAIIFIAAVLIAVVVDRLLFGRAEAVAARTDTAVFSRGARTRLRVLRRLIFVAIILLGAALALSQFEEAKRVGTALLASTAVVGLVIGFAARPVVANAVSGVLLAATQTVRIGDRVSVADRTGRVVDIALTYTSIDVDDGALMIVPNELIVAETLINHSSGDTNAEVVASLWLPAGADVETSRKALEAVGVSSVKLVETRPRGTRLEVRTEKKPGQNRIREEAELRERAQSALRRAGAYAPATLSPQ